MIEAVNTQLVRYYKQKNQGMLLMLDTPNTPRILSECKDDKKLMRAMLAYLFMQTGSPVLLYGTELGLTVKVYQLTEHVCNGILKTR
uniref:CAZy families GH13/CBM34 protein n=1 Tax=uncultured Enterococcus sp. TaxID=167972 RepID=A0A060C5Y3_9ENTE|nr:CAZy families GH13/CBM34 protein [uncultured Enterococcus sp.]